MKVSILNPAVTSYYDPHLEKWIKSDHPIDFFWIECTLHEVWMIHQTYISDDRMYLKLYDDPTEHDKFYFWVSRDFGLILQSFWVMPYSAMNGLKENYVRFDPIEIQTLEELEELKELK